MTALPEPIDKARATARMIAARAQSLTSLAEQVFSENAQSTNITHGEWEELITQFETLADELKQECETFSWSAKHLAG